MQIQDTSSKLKQDILRKMSAQDKWNEALRLREMSWQIKLASVRLQHPDWDTSRVEAEVKKIFLYATT